MNPDFSTNTGMGSYADPLARVFDAFVALEGEHAAHELELGGTRIWSALRRTMFINLLQMLQITGEFQSSAPILRARKENAWRNIVMRSPVLRMKPAPNVVVKWERLQRINGDPADVISWPILDCLPREETLEFDAYGNVSRHGPNSFSLESLTLPTKLAGRLRPASILPPAARSIARLEDALATLAGQPFPLAEMFAREAACFALRRSVMARLFKRWGTKTVFVCVAYGHLALVAAAKDAGARVIEVQHGLIGRTHTGYDFPNGIRPAYQPDTILLFGEYWKNAARYPDGIELVTFGAPFIRAKLDAASAANAGRARRNAIMFISQPGIFRQLLDFALRVAAIDGAPKVIFRLHPNDDPAQVNKLVSQAGLPRSRFEISAGGGGGVTLEQQCEVSFQAGAFSTSVLEGIAAGARTFLAPVPGVSINAALVNSNLAQWVSSPEDLVSKISQSPESDPAGVETVRETFFAKAVPAIIKDIIRA
jgi:hypothetical protein